MLSSAATPISTAGEFIDKDESVVNHVEAGKADPDAVARCAATAKAHPPVDQWQSTVISGKDGTVLTTVIIAGWFGDCRDASQLPASGVVRDADELAEIRSATAAAMLAFHDFKPWPISGRPLPRRTW
jgi:hypothetical protein